MAGMKADAESLVKRWRGKDNENQDTQLFWIDLLQGLPGVKDTIPPQNISPSGAEQETNGATKYVVQQIRSNLTENQTMANCIKQTAPPLEGRRQHVYKTKK